MNGSTIPEGNVDWTSIREASITRWAVEERAEMFVAHLVAQLIDSRWEPPKAPTQLLIWWEAHDKEKAEDWLHYEAERDAQLWQPCQCCGKIAHATKGPAPGYCSHDCAQMSDDNST